MQTVKVTPGNRRQRAVTHGFNSRHRKGRKYTEGTGQQRTNSRGANDLGCQRIWLDLLGYRSVLRKQSGPGLTEPLPVVLVLRGAGGGPGQLPSPQEDVPGQAELTSGNEHGRTCSSP